MTSPAHTSPMEQTLKFNTDLEVCQVLYLETLSALLESVPLNSSLLKQLMNRDLLRHPSSHSGSTETLTARREENLLLVALIL